MFLILLRNFNFVTSADWTSHALQRNKAEINKDISHAIFCDDEALRD